MDTRFAQALKMLATEGDALRASWRLTWPPVVQQIVHRLRLDLSTVPVPTETGLPAATGAAKKDASTDEAPRPALAALVGGASSGKSTIFNNLLDGHLTSRITARGHATLGPILAIHEQHREAADRLLGEDRLLPGLRRVSAELDENVAGEPDALVVAYHGIDALRNVWLFDLPDFTSEAAHVEGDICLTLLPWFDRVAVVMDHERWFDRQSFSMLRAESVRLGQERWVLFNRTKEGPMADEDRAMLAAQAERLNARGMTILPFRRGRGFFRFAPGTLDDTLRFLIAPPPDRRKALLAALALAANQALNQTEERRAALRGLREAMDHAVARALPASRDCLTVLMTRAERDQLDLIARVLRLGETRAWLASQARRLQAAMHQVPMVGWMVPSASQDAAQNKPPSDADRLAIGLAHAEGVQQRQFRDVQRAVAGSAFWDEVRRWTGLEPAEPRAMDGSLSRAELEEALRRLDAALTAWNRKVTEECHGLSPHLKGALGVGGVALAVILIAVPGPVTALTLATAKGAIAAGLADLLLASGAGALFGRSITRLRGVLEEKLIGSAELEAVQEAVNAYRNLLEQSGRRLVASARAEANALVLPERHPLAAALADVSEGKHG